MCILYYLGECVWYICIYFFNEYTGNNIIIPFFHNHDFSQKTDDRQSFEAFCLGGFFSTETNPSAASLSAVHLTGRYIYSPPPRHRSDSFIIPRPRPTLTATSAPLSRSRTISYLFYSILPSIYPPHPLPVGSASETNFRPNPLTSPLATPTRPTYELTNPHTYTRAHVRVCVCAVRARRAVDRRTL